MGDATRLHGAEPAQSGQRDEKPDDGTSRDRVLEDAEIAEIWRAAVKKITEGSFGC